jgi:hypothetical protein
MKPGQTRVLVLLVVLLALEAVVHPGIKQWINGTISAINTTFSGGSTHNGSFSILGVTVGPGVKSSSLPSNGFSGVNSTAPRNANAPGYGRNIS